MRPAWFGFILWMVAACRTSPLGQPDDAVKRFFQAVAAGDCEAAIGTLSQSYRAELNTKHLSCDEYLGTWRRFQLERLIETQVDGRNHRAYLVRAHLRGRQTDSIIRVEAEGDQWRIFSI
jgi:hypothetical protein